MGAELADLLEEKSDLNKLLSPKGVDYLAVELEKPVGVL